MPVDFRYRKLGYLALNVTDIEKSTHFATEVFGLDLVEELADGGRCFRLGTSHHDIILTPAQEPTFERSSWELETEADVDKAFTHYTRLGLLPTWLSDRDAYLLNLERAFRIVEPILGTTWEYYARMSQIAIPRTNHLTRFQGGKHYGLVVPDCKAATDYMVDNMGFLVSDYLEGWKGSLLRAFPNPNHHSFAPLQVPLDRPAFHHVAFMVEEIDDIGKLFNRVKRYDVDIQFGIGRHPTSGSIHLYIYDFDNYVWEYTLGMEQFPESGAREPRRMSSEPGNLDLWDAVPDLSRTPRYPALVRAAA